MSLLISVILQVLLPQLVASEIDPDCRASSRAYDEKAARLALIERGRVMTRLRDIYLPLLQKLDTQKKGLDRGYIENALKAFRHNLIVKRFAFTNMYDPNSWLEYQVDGSPAAQEWLTTTHGVNVTNRHNAEMSRLQTWTSFDQNFKHYYLAIPANGVETQGLDHLGLSKDRSWIGANTPVTAYGETFALHNLFTQHVLMEWAGHSLESLLAQVWEDHRDFLIDHAARPKEVYKKEGVLSSIYEGFLTINQAVNQLLATKIKGVDNYREALRLVLMQTESTSHRNVMVDFVQRLSMGNVGPITLGGRYSKTTLVRSADGTIRLHHKLIRNLGAMKRRAQRNRPIIRDPEDVETGMGCPMGFSKGSGDKISGIEYAAMMYYHTFLIVDDLFNSGRVH